MCPHRCECSAVFNQKWHDPSCLTLPIHPMSPQATFCVVFWNEKVLKRKQFAHVEEVKQKMAEALKGIKIDEFKTVLSSEKMSQ